MNDVYCPPLDSELTAYGCWFLYEAKTPECIRCPRRPVKPQKVDNPREESCQKAPVKLTKKRKPRGWRNMTPAVLRAFMDG